MSGVALVVGAFLVVFGVSGLRLIFGVWVRPLEAEFAVDRAAMSFAAALGLLSYGLAQPILGRLVDVRGPRAIVPGSVLLTGLGIMAASQMPSFLGFVLVWGIVPSIGFAGAANATIAALVVQRFARHQGLIFSICTAGGPLGELVLASGVTLGIAAAGWRVTMFGFGAALLVVILPITAILLAGARPPARAPLPSFAATCRLALRSRGFVLLWWAYFICGVTTLGLVHTHIVPYGIDRGLPELAAAQILGLVGLFNIVGLVVAGRIADRWGGRRPLIVVFMLRAVTLLWLATATSQEGLAFFALVFGLTDMATIPLSAAAAAEMFGPRLLGALVGLLVLAHQIGSALGSYLAGLGYALLGGYPPVIVAAVGVSLVAALLSYAMDTRPVESGLAPAAA